MGRLLVASGNGVLSINDHKTVMTGEYNLEQGKIARKKQIGKKH